MKKKKNLHLNLHVPTHCESQVALKENEECNDENDSSQSDSLENVYINGTSSHYTAPGFRTNLSFDMSDSGLNMDRKYGNNSNNRSSNNSNSNNKNSKPSKK